MLQGETTGKSSLLEEVGQLFHETMEKAQLKMYLEGEIPLSEVGNVVSVWLQDHEDDPWVERFNEIEKKVEDEICRVAERDKNTTEYLEETRYDRVVEFLDEWQAWMGREDKNIPRKLFSTLYYELEDFRKTGYFLEDYRSPALFKTEREMTPLIEAICRYLSLAKDAFPYLNPRGENFSRQQLFDFIDAYMKTNNDTEEKRALEEIKIRLFAQIKYLQK